MAREDGCTQVAPAPTRGGTSSPTGPDLEGVVLAISTDSAVLAEPLTLDSAARYIHDHALADSVVGAVGLEVETHLVDLADVGERVGWPRLSSVLDGVRSVPQRSAVTVEPGGQVELSGLPEADVVAAVGSLRHDEQRLRLALVEHGLGLAHLGTDPLRAPRRVNPRPRYQAMEQHFTATGRGEAGVAMMCSTAALQVNLQAGHRAAWAERVARAHRLGPTLVAISACSRWLAGRDSGWVSSRERVWAGLDPRTSGVIDGGADPADAWTAYALNAPVLFECEPGRAAVAVNRCVSFGDWASGRAPLAGRVPTLDDLRTHLTTLFPPVRLRGYLELRYLDVSAPRWWPAVAAVTTTLMDDPVAAAAADEATEPAAARWTEAARDGLGDPLLATSARKCMAIAVERAPAELATAVADLAELVDSGRCPGDLVSDRIAKVGPAALFEEVAHA